MMKYVIDEEKGWVFSRAFGRVSMADIMMHVQEILQDPAYRSGLNALLYLDGVVLPEMLELTGGFRKFMAGLVKERGNSRWAIVSPDATCRTKAQSMLAGQHLHNIQLAFFDDDASAKAWLADAGPAPAQ